jgi:mRNA interferase HicA
MKRTKFIAHLNAHKCALLREGTKHSIFQNLITGVRVSVPRHASVLDTTAQAVCRQLGIPRLK